MRFCANLSCRLIQEHAYLHTRANYHYIGLLPVTANSWYIRKGDRVEAEVSRTLECRDRRIRRETSEVWERTHHENFLKETFEILDDGVYVWQPRILGLPSEESSTSVGSVLDGHRHGTLALCTAISILSSAASTSKSVIQSHWIVLHRCSAEIPPLSMVTK